ncbi:uncharacterized protein LOC127266470 [Andrographis paniculata]|uniref:uncharacterized protein LOC127266470 n=1 Tax=Andrographis paniculata TaxID=175694 RepID=UPI0021E8E140|nr:uncharacterized protein LOC127266470 [Andrographis paniculata]
MCAVRNEVQKRMFWVLGNGACSFWHNHWCGDKPIADMVGGHHHFVKVSNYWNNRQWNHHLLYDTLPTHVVDMIVGVPLESSTKDTVIWKDSNSGQFSISSVWNSIRCTAPRSLLFKKIWNPFLTPTMSVFLWRLLLNKIPLDVYLHKLGISLASKCQCCKGVESIENLFLTGVQSSMVWRYFYTIFTTSPTNTTSIRQLLLYWILSCSKSHTMHIRTILPMLILWFIWGERNDAKHRATNFSSDRIIAKVKSHIRTTHCCGKWKHSHWTGDTLLATQMNLLPPPSWNGATNCCLEEATGWVV